MESNITIDFNKLDHVELVKRLKTALDICADDRETGEYDPDTVIARLADQIDDVEKVLRGAA